MLCVAEEELFHAVYVDITTKTEKKNLTYWTLSKFTQQYHLLLGEHEHTEEITRNICNKMSGKKVILVMFHHRKG